MAGTKKLVIGASGFLGSHVTRKLARRGEDVRVMVRPTSSLAAIEDLDVQYHFGDIFDDAAVHAAMADCDDVYYCVVDARAWLRDPAPLFRTNVEGLQRVLDVALDADLRRFVFTSTIATIGIPAERRPATEDDPFNWPEAASAYIRSRVAAEDLVLRYARDRGLPAVAMCVANTYGPGDWQPTPHGRQVALAAAGRLPFYIRGWTGEAVGIEDAAEAMLLVAEKGRIGERYIVSQRFMSVREIYDIAADATGARSPRFGVPLAAMYALGLIGDAGGGLLRRDTQLSRKSVRLMHIMPPLDHGKAERELGWRPAPIEDSIRRGARFFREQRTRRRKDA